MTSPASGWANRWTSNLDRFHEDHPGITEDVLSQACDVDGMNPYVWLLAAAPRRPGVLPLDLACGSGPLQLAGSHLSWIGIDRSPGELARAGRAEGVLVRGDGLREPFRDATFDLVACSMALMLFDPVDALRTEIDRVLRDEGRLILLLPGSVPLSRRDRVRYLRLLSCLRKVRPVYPNRVHLGRLRARLARAGLNVVSDQRRCFRYPIRDEGDAGRFTESLYAPGVSTQRLDRTLRVARSWVGSTLGIPLRRVVCDKAAQSTRRHDNAAGPSSAR